MVILKPRSHSTVRAAIHIGLGSCARHCKRMEAAPALNQLANSRSLLKLERSPGPTSPPYVDNDIVQPTHWPQSCIRKPVEAGTGIIELSRDLRRPPFLRSRSHERAGVPTDWVRFRCQRLVRDGTFGHHFQEDGRIFSDIVLIFII
jgi:hypothetical protein